jgi:hypothetical protein
MFVVLKFCEKKASCRSAAGCVKRAWQPCDGVPQDNKVFREALIKEPLGNNCAFP